MQRVRNLTFYLDAMPQLTLLLVVAVVVNYSATDRRLDNRLHLYIPARVL